MRRMIFMQLIPQKLRGNKQNNNKIKQQLHINNITIDNDDRHVRVQYRHTDYNRAYFSVYYYTKCVLLKAHCATLKMKMCNINFMLGIKTEAAECLLNSPNAKFLHFQGLLLIP